MFHSTIIILRNATRTTRKVTKDYIVRRVLQIHLYQYDSLTIFHTKTLIITFIVKKVTYLF